MSLAAAEAARHPVLCVYGCWTAAAAAAGTRESSPTKEKHTDSAGFSAKSRKTVQKMRMGGETAGCGREGEEQHG